MKARLNIISVLLLLLTVLAIPLSARTKHAGEIPIYSKTIERSIPLREAVSLDILNQSGDIILHEWDEDQISVKVNVSSYAKDVQKAKEKVNNIELLTEVSDGHVRISVLDKASNSPAGFFGKVGQLINESNTELDFEIFVPKNLTHLNIDNSLGDVQLDIVRCPSDIKLRYGDLKCPDFKKSFALDARFSNILIGSAVIGNVSLQNSKLEIKTIKSIVVPQSSFSQINIGKIDTFYSSKISYGKVHIGYAEKVLLQSSFTGITINELNQGGRIGFTFADAQVRQLNSNATEFAANGKFGDLNLRMQADLAYLLQLQTESGSIDLKESDFTKITYENSSKKTEKKLNAQRGNQTSAIPIRIILSQGTVTIETLP